mmetsp:Transcript_24205/g.33874  ORF Transcript_24205/g.33874 Transcript_24205/m.33874 type:complete len:426 (+) Transcript_24205:117-1394(+)
MDPIDRELAALENERSELNGYRIVRGAGNFRMVKDRGEGARDTWHGVDPASVGHRASDTTQAAGYIVRKSHDFTYRPKQYSAASERMHSDIYQKDPILRPQSSDPKNTKTVVRENLRNLYGSDPINNPNSAPTIPRKAWLMPDNGGRDPILDGDQIVTKPSKRLVPEHQNRDNSFVPRPLCRAPRQPISTDSAGVRSKEIGRRQAWGHYFEDFKSIRNRNTMIQPKEGKEEQFKNSRAWGPTSHMLNTRDPILQKEDQFARFREPKSLKTFERHLKQSDPEKFEYQWKNSRGSVKDRNTSKSRVDELMKGRVPPDFDPRTQWKPSLKTREGWNRSNKDIYEYNHSGGISDRNEIMERVISQERYAENIQRFHKKGTRVQRPEKATHLRSSMNIFDHEGERAGQDIYVRRQQAQYPDHGRQPGHWN